MLNKFIEVLCWLIAATAISTALGWFWTYLGIFVYERVKKWLKRDKNNVVETSAIVIAGKNIRYKWILNSYELKLISLGLRDSIANSEILDIDCMFSIELKKTVDKAISDIECQ